MPPDRKASARYFLTHLSLKPFICEMSKVRHGSPLSFYFLGKITLLTASDKWHKLSQQQFLAIGLEISESHPLSPFPTFGCPTYKYIYI